MLSAVHLRAPALRLGKHILRAVNSYHIVAECGETSRDRPRAAAEVESQLVLRATALFDRSVDKLRYTVVVNLAVQLFIIRCKGRCSSVHSSFPSPVPVFFDALAGSDCFLCSARRESTVL